MSLAKFAALSLLALPVAAQVPLPELRIEPTAGGSIFFVKNVASQPLTAYLIELVDYPGSSFTYFRDELVSEGPIAPAAEKRIPVANMTVGAVPDYVKIQAALYAGGTSSGDPAKVAQIVERRRFLLETSHELTRRLEQAQKAGSSKEALVGDLKQWTQTMQIDAKSKRQTQTTINHIAAVMFVRDTAIWMIDGNHSLDETIAQARAQERALAASVRP